MLTDSEVEKLVYSARKGDAEAFSALVRAHYRAAWCAAMAVLRDSEEAKDVVQDAFVSAFTEMESVREPARFSGWLLRIVRNRALGALSKNKAAFRVPLDDISPAKAVERTNPVLRDRLLWAAQVLTSREAEVLFLHDLEGLTHPEIARGMEISEVLSRQVLFEARKKMRARMATGEMEDSHEQG